MRPQLLLAMIVMLTPQPLAQDPSAFDLRSAERFAGLALACLHQEYPNKISHVLNGDADVKAPRTLTPVFFGCYDWHSAVHGHWLLVRLLRFFPEAPFAVKAKKALAKSFVKEAVATELAYLEGTGRGPFERPYGLAWLLLLGAEVATAKDPEVRAWSAILEPLEALAARRFQAWLPKLGAPARTGEHSQTAFALGLVLDAARLRGNKELENLVVDRARHYFLKDRGWKLAFEPGGEDFLSPGLAEADLMRRFLSKEEFGSWFAAFLPEFSAAGPSPTLVPGVVSDKKDGKLAHLDGLNLSRAWMLEGIADGLPQGDPRIPIITALSLRHREAGLAAVTGEHYEGGHWLGTFAVYLVTRRGL